ncbi:MAG: hypothetical protein L0H83_13460 [Salinisphaera sp.]|nr:hypothetical protein [Salinisphaera sp.]
MNSTYRIESCERATLCGRGGRMIELYDENGPGSVFVGKYFIPTSIRSDKAAVEYALEARAQQDEELTR